MTTTAAGTAVRDPLPLLFLLSDTGGGHRSAATAVGEALERRWPGRFAPLLHDPLLGPAAPRRLRAIASLYGPGIRVAPWLWGALWHSGDNDRGHRFWERTVLAPVPGIVAAAVAARRPAAVVSFHALTVRPAVAARDALAPGVPVVTVITDLVTPHLSWRCGGVDRIAVPTPAVLASCEGYGVDPGRLADLGLPVSAAFAAGPLPPAARSALRRSLGVSARRPLVVVAGGAEGAGGIAERVTALVRQVREVDVVALCGRNERARRVLAPLAARAGGRLVVRGHVDDVAGWLRAADVVVTKAGPGTIAEATCCGAALVLTSSVPGQEEGNIAHVTGAGAGYHAATVAGMVTHVRRLCADRALLADVRAASARLGRPRAAADVAALIAGLCGPAAPTDGRDLSAAGATP